MRGTVAITCVLAAMSGGIWAQQSAAPQSAQKTEVSQKKTFLKKTSSKKSRKAAAPAPQRLAQTTPPLPATLLNSAPVAPHVTMESGLLTIDAPNSTLSDVLSGIHNATGAAIEGATPSERVAVKLGPGNPRQVIAALLRGTTYDYVILGAQGSPDGVTRVLLTQQTSQSSGGGDSSAQPSSIPQPIRQQQSTDESMPERAGPDEAAAPPNADNDPDQAQQPPQAPQPPQAQQQQPPQQQPAQQDPNQPKTPEQLFKELQQLEQQKQPK